jgi:hypothetical protein|tara:strand:- start:679 stop:2796 length:2118 start_codon:yes stop_codon:yes gene_type:complete
MVSDESEVILFGQPPEVLKGLLLKDVSEFSTLVLTDIKEKDGSLLNNLEFPLYFFLFVANGLSKGEKITLVGEEMDICHALRLLRFTLLGPTKAELDNWESDAGLRKEWLDSAEALALKDSNDRILSIESFFDIRPFDNGVVKLADLSITHTGQDLYVVSNSDKSIEVDLNEDTEIRPPYHVQSDYVPGGLIKMGLEILGGASGFTPDEPCTGLALCYNGDYILIDAIPFLDQHLIARGIAKNQISGIFLTHLHDDHCGLFPLIMMPHKVEVITTRAIFNMAMEKLSCNLGWKPEVMAGYFRFMEVKPGEKRNFYGLNVEPHVTVHSIPTIGATFTTIHKGYSRHMCIVGDNHSMTTARELCKAGAIRQETIDNLDRIYHQRFSLLVADGGAGAIHGDPADALESQSDRVVFVHVEELPNEFNTTFSLASSGKRYTVIEGDSSIYTSQITHYLTLWLGEPFPNRWMRSLLAEEEIRRYNADDVIIVQDAETRGFIYLILTGYCEVVRHDGSELQSVADLQAGDVIGEMAVITGRTIRNASVVARTPVTVCVFAEETFLSFIESEGFKEKLIRRWAIRPILKVLPQFSNLASAVLEKVGNLAVLEKLEAGQSTECNTRHWYVLSEGTAECDGQVVSIAEEFGWRPFTTARKATITTKEGCTFITFPAKRMEALVRDVPQLNYFLRRQRVDANDPSVDWLLGKVPVN